MAYPPFPPQCGQYPIHLLAASLLDTLGDDILVDCFDHPVLRQQLFDGLKHLVKTGVVDPRLLLETCDADASVKVFHAAAHLQPGIAANLPSRHRTPHYSGDGTHCHHRNIIGQPAVLPDEILGSIFFYLPLKDLLAGATSCRCWQLVSRQRGATNNLELTTTSQLESFLSPGVGKPLLSSRSVSITTLVLLPQERLHKYYEGRIDDILCPFSGNPDTGDDRARALQVLELNANLPFSPNVLSNLLLSSSTTLRHIDLSAGQCQVSFTLPGVSFPNLACLRACDDWWNIDFDDGFTCDNLLYLGLRASPATRSLLPVTWRKWLMRLKHLRRLILLVDPEDEEEETEGGADVPFHETSGAREDPDGDSGATHHSLLTGDGMSSPMTGRTVNRGVLPPPSKTHFSEAVLHCLRGSYHELLELRLFDYTSAGINKSFDLVYFNLMMAMKQHELNTQGEHYFGKLQEIALASPSDIHQAKLSKVGWYPFQDAYCWGGGALFRPISITTTEEVHMMNASSQQDVPQLYAFPNQESDHAYNASPPLWVSLPRSSQGDDAETAGDGDMQLLCSTTKSAPA